MGALRQEYAELGGGTTASPFLVGPDVTQHGVVGTGQRNEYLRDFLLNFTSMDHGVDRVTYHQYFPSSSTVKDMTSPPLLDSLKVVLGAAKSAFENYTQAQARDRAQAQLWLGETGLELNSQASGSAPPVGPFHLDCGKHQVGVDCYFGGVVAYLDKLGLAARYGHAVVARQAITHLLPKNHSDGGRVEPVPGYWAALLFKRLMGPAVLAIAGGLEEGRTLRAYATFTCGRLPTSTVNTTASVSIVLMNLGDAPETVSIDLLSVRNSSMVPSSSADLYLLESFPTASDWNGTGIALNGVELVAADDGTLPKLNPRAVSSPVVIPPRAVAFVTLLVPQGITRENLLFLLNA